MTDYTDDLAAAENSLRRIIERVGRDTYGDDWLARLGISDAIIRRWRANRDREHSARGGGIEEERLIYFSNFGDLEKLIVDNWALFEPVFIDRGQTTVYLSKLRELRNPDAHRRELTEGEKSLIIGISSELRTRVTRYLCRRDTPDEFFPRLESMRDSLGNPFEKNYRPVIRVGDVLEFIAEGWDPEGGQLEFQWSVSPHSDLTFQDWSTNNRFTWRVQDNQVANPTWVNLNMRGPREPHAEGSRDAGWSMAYTVLPAR
jgi:hypothetical protein